MPLLCQYVIQSGLGDGQGVNQVEVPQNRRSEWSIPFSGKVGRQSEGGGYGDSTLSRPADGTLPNLGLVSFYFPVSDDHSNVVFGRRGGSGLLLAQLAGRADTQPRDAGLDAKW